ncbi:VTT domain-containing protein [Granulicella paludicola]|uniref:VTT domain-containing protein n=1 Tax=Granulicella paludicola TaxID=474951 RepID=UPI0021E083DE|nr:VTT domain-containing protein [Granulicella paludicola]
MATPAQLTYPGIAMAVFAQQFCLPVPSLLLLMTAGALAAQGDGNLRLWLVLLSGIVGCLAADGFWFWLGRRWGSGVIRLVCSFTPDPRRSREKAKGTFDRWGLRLLLVAKFVPGLDGISPPLAGAEGATVRGFVLYDAAGSAIWTATYVVIGYIFANQMDVVMHGLQRFGLLLIVLVGGPLLGYVLWRAMRMVRMIRHLRLRRISPALLQAKLNENDRVAVIDLLNYEADERVTAGIPGALRVDPARLRLQPKLIVPEGVDVVLYCSTKNEFASARVAESLGKMGFADVWVLEGGLQAWVQEGRPVSIELNTPEQFAERLGIVRSEDAR